MHVLHQTPLVIHSLIYMSSIFVLELRLRAGKERARIPHLKIDHASISRAAASNMSADGFNGPKTLRSRTSCGHPMKLCTFLLPKPILLLDE
jgi:hypothetical protein